MNGDFPIDTEDIVKYLGQSEVFSLFFPLLGKSLVVDSRCDAQEGPLIRVVPMVASVEERVKSLRRLRPRFPRPRQLVAIPWTKHVYSLYLWGIWDKIVQPLLARGYPDTQSQCNQALLELLEAEKEEIAKALTGEGYHTLWKS